MPPAVRVIVAGLALALSAGCGAADTASPVDQALRTCGPVVRERLDAGSALHLLPGAHEPTYLSDPPTSGPHRSGPAPTGVQETPLDRPTQVLVLETGGVVLQHRDLNEGDTAALATLAAEHVVVAPNPSLPTSVVATAWLTKQTCERFDLDTLAAFVADNSGQGPKAG